MCVHMLGRNPLGRSAVLTDLVDRIYNGVFQKTAHVSDWIIRFTPLILSSH